MDDLDDGLGRLELNKAAAQQSSRGIGGMVGASAPNSPKSSAWSSSPNSRNNYDNDNYHSSNSTNRYNSANARAGQSSLKRTGGGFKARRPDQWSIIDVTDWLESEGFKSIVRNFEEHEITGDILLDLNLSSLRELGVENLADRITILHSILALKESPPKDSAYVDEHGAAALPLSSMPHDVCLFILIHSIDSHINSVAPNRSDGSSFNNTFKLLKQQQHITTTCTMTTTMKTNHSRNSNTRVNH